MKLRKFGTTGTTVFPLGYGAMSLTNFYGEIDDAGADAVLTKALDLGIDHLDTSNIYGLGVSETRIGAFLAKQGKQRDGFFKIANKASIVPSKDGPPSFNNSADHLESELDKSLGRLGVDSVELFYIHRREATRPIEEVTETLAGLIKKGKIRQFGFSEIAPTSLATAAAIHPVGAVQSEYSLSTRYPELGLVQRTKQLGTTMVAFSPVGRTLLTDHPVTREKAETIAFLKTNERFIEPNLTRNRDATADFRKLAADLGITAAGLAIAWLLHKDDHIIPIPGTRSPQRLAEMAAAVEVTLTDSDLAEIDRILPVGWAHGDRYTQGQWNGPEKYC